MQSGLNRQSGNILTRVQSIDVRILKHLTRPLVPVNAKETELYRQLPVASDLKI